jgi:uncharacterized membrane protein
MWDWHDTTGMTIGMIAFWLLIAALAYYLFRSATPAPEPYEPRGVTVLEQRFARGEISADEYRERRSVLEGHDLSEAPEPPPSG